MLREAARQRLQAIAERGQTRVRRLAHGPTAARQAVGLPGEPAEPRLLFCSNDYLGLAAHPAVVQALVDGARRHGAGAGASHLVSGHHRVHEEVEARFAQGYGPWIARPRALGFSTGYMANLAVVTGLAALAPRDDVALFSDELNHASLIDACRLSKVAVHRYPHADAQALQALLKASPARLKLIITDGVFSMDGDLAPLADLLALAEAHDAWLVVDDAHGLGVLGENGWGSVEALLAPEVASQVASQVASHGVCGGSANARREPGTDRLIVVGTLGKAVGVAGAFVVAHEELIEVLLQTARPYIFTTASPPALSEAVMASLKLIGSEEGQRRRAHLQDLIGQWRSGIQALQAQHPGLGWVLLPSTTPIQPLVVHDNQRAMDLAHFLESRGLRVPAIRPPTVAPGSARLRVTFCADHTPSDVAELLSALNAFLDTAT